MLKEIGGYFELELPPGDMSQLPPGTLVNSGRNALEYVLRTLGNKVRRVWMPYYTCDVVLEPIRRLNFNYSFYHINSDLEITSYPELKGGDYLIVNNYFGIKDRYVYEMADKYGDHLIVDNAQAWYCKPQFGSHFIYSPRKFFGLPDGGVVSCAIDTEIKLPQGFSSDRCNHLLKRIDSDASSGYADFRDNSNQLKEEPLTRMSKLTERLLGAVDFERAKKRRQTNFEYLHSVLAATNRLTLPAMNEFECPMIYPYLTDRLDLRKRLIDNQVYVATYWPNVLEWCHTDSFEYDLTKNMIPLPIDQRYGVDDMKIIDKIIRMA